MWIYDLVIWYEPVNDGERVKIVESRNNFSRVEKGGGGVEPARTDLNLN